MTCSANSATIQCLIGMIIFYIGRKNHHRQMNAEELVTRYDARFRRVFLLPDGDGNVEDAKSR